jgi:peroxiredoxin
MPLIKIGTVAPVFTLKDQHNQELKLSDFRGKKVLLSWHPLAFTKICARQMQSLEKHLKDFAALNTLPIGMSVDTVPSKHAWAKAIKVKDLRMLSDFWPHGAVAKKFGILRKEGFSERANIIIDEQGRVAWAKAYPIKELPDVNELLAVLEL